MSDVEARPAFAVDPSTGLQLAVPRGWSARLGGPETARRLVLTPPDDDRAGGARLVAVCLPSGEDVRIAGPSAATVLVAGQSGRVVDYGTWGVGGRTVLFATEAPGAGSAGSAGSASSPSSPGGAGGRAQPTLGRLWMTSHERMLTTITLLAPAHAWDAAEAAAAAALAGLRLPRPGGTVALATSGGTPRVDVHLARYGLGVEDLTALADAQPRALLGRRVSRGCVAWLLRLPLPGPGVPEPGPCPDVRELADPDDSAGPDDPDGRVESVELAADAPEDPSSHPAALPAELRALGLASGDRDLEPTRSGLAAARMLQSCGARVRVDIQDPGGAATAFVRVAGPHLLALTSDDTSEDDAPGARRARALRLHVAPSSALPLVLAGQVRLGPAWTLPMPDLSLPAADLAARWSDPAVPAPLPDPHLAAWWGQPWSLVTLRWSATDGHEHATRLLRAGARGWVRLTPNGGTATASVVPTGEVWGHLLEIAAALAVD